VDGDKRIHLVGSPLQKMRIGLAATAQKEFHVIIEKREDRYYVASVIELPGCHTQAKNLE
jgi:hypothetical protein